METEIKGVRADMTANNIAMEEAVHPGELIKDELESRGISQASLAHTIGMAPSVLNEVINGKRAVSVEYAMLLEAALDIDADTWLNLQTQYSKHRARSNPSLMRRIAAIRGAAAL